MSYESDNKRKKAEKWVNGYTASAVATVAGTALVPVPGAATVVLCGLEVTMCYQIGKIYKNEWSMGDAAAAAKLVGLAAIVGQLAALEATTLLGPFGIVARGGIAAGIVKSMGKLVISHFEDIA
jgi:uncharacterized protein (DUF697 family)